MKNAHILHESCPLASLREGTFFVIVKVGDKMYIKFNGNPCGQSTGDCVIRAISIVTELNRHKVYAGLCVTGYPCTIWGNSNTVWAEYLRHLGYTRHSIGRDDDYTVADFAAEHPHGRYVIGTGNHAVAVVDGNIVDSWNSSKEIPRYYFVKE